MAILIRRDPGKSSGGRLPPTRGLAPHLAAIALPNGKRLGEMSSGEIANVCALFAIPGAHENGKTRNAELLSEKLEEIGRQAAEKAIADFMAATMGGSAVGGGPVGGAP